MSDMRYDTDQLRDGGRTSRQASDQAQSAGNTISSAQVSAGPFGNVSPAGSLAGVLSQAQQHHARGAQTAAANRDVAGQRADVTAAAGDDLTAVTTTVARSGMARDVANGMS
jgi:hypothetical protein